MTKEPIGKHKMSMDALTSQALKSLIEKVVPSLSGHLTALGSVDPDEREPWPELEEVIQETIELLNLVSGWVRGDEVSSEDESLSISDDDELNDDEALALLDEAGGNIDSGEHLANSDEGQDLDDDELQMLKAMEEDTGAIGDPVEDEAGDSGHALSDDDEASRMLALMDDDPTGEAPELAEEDEAMRLLSEVDDSDASNVHDPSEELSDDEAQMLLAQMGDDGGVGEANAITNTNNDDDMSDDEAARLLAEMDGGGSDGGGDDMSDDEAQRLLSEMDGGGSDGGGDDMSDDEAQRLLSEMDGGGSDGGGNDMSDDEAQRLLSEMDGGGAGEAKAEASVDDDDMSAEALLAQLGGDDDEDEDEIDASPTSAQAQAPAAVASAPAPRAQASHASALSDADLDIEEIDEWEPNDFQTDPDMVEDFNNNCDELMETLDETVLRLEGAPDDSSIIEEIFRAAHTLKGASGMFGFKGLERIVHKMENLFDLIRKGKLTPTSDIIDVMFSGLDIVRELLEAVKNGKPCGIKTAGIVKNLILAAEGRPIDGGGRKGAEAKPRAKEAQATDGEGAKSGGAGGGGGKSDKNKEVSTIRVDLNRLDVLVNLVGELVIDRTRFVTIEEELRTNYPEVKLSGNISETVQLFGRHMNEIQDIIMKVRMVPIGNAFNKYPRIVRDLAKQLGKNIDLVISGENAELDKTLVEQIGDPLIHLIRNSCDHGIELPEDREKSGKDPRGTIFLGAHQEGNHIVISIEDDGKGIPADIIRKKGIEKGLISEDDKLNKREIFNLIFEPGFSTAEKITNVSGRGVGMDVVKKQIMKLKGMLEVDSELGQGTTITIRLPLTLAIVQSLLIKAAGETFAVPLGSVIESIRIGPDEIQKVGDAEVVKLRDKVLPLMHLDRELHLSQKKGTLVDFISEHKDRSRRREKDRLFVVVVGSPDRPFGILVDQLLTQQEMVIKSMGRFMNTIPCVSGGAVLGNGEVVLVLDIAELEQKFSTKNRSHAA